MLSREQIESVRAMLVKGVGPMVPVFTGLCDLATKAIDTERDAALGKAVNEATRFDADSLLHCASFLERNGYESGVPVLRAIAAHLRKVGE